MLQNSGTERNLSLDGLRGMAVLLVLLYHHALLRLGWIGVDVFFVLSGFLITGVLRRTRKDKSYWTEFWIKRATRILPPFLLVLCAATAVGYAPAKLFFLYLATLADLVAVLHPSVAVVRPLWSLAIEEHFYLLWPFAVRYLTRRSLLPTLLALLIAEPALRFAASYSGHVSGDFLYFLTPFRLDGLILGSLLCLLMESDGARQWLRRVSLVLCAATALFYGTLRAVLGASFTREGNSPTYNALSYLLIALTATWLISYLVLHPKGAGARGFSSRPLVWVGQISYGVYLYQVFILYAATSFTHAHIRRAIVMTGPLTLLVSWVSFRYMEAPLILWGKRRARRYSELGGDAEFTSPATAP